MPAVGDTPYLGSHSPIWADRSPLEPISMLSADGGLPPVKVMSSLAGVDRVLQDLAETFREGFGTEGESVVAAGEGRHVGLQKVGEGVGALRDRPGGGGARGGDDACGL